MKNWLICCTMPLVLTAAPLPWEEGARRTLDAYDQERPLPKLSLKGPDQPHLQWLKAAARQTRPANPYPRGSRPWKEAEAVRAFLSANSPQTDLQHVPLTLEGSRMALWRWGQAKVRKGEMDPGFRRAWEDRLMSGPLDLLHYYATRHALCFSLAEGDLSRFQKIQEDAPKDYEAVIRMFQQAFPLLGGPCPPLRVWTLPTFESREVPLNELGPKGTWIAPLADFPTPPPEGWAWILPTPTGSQSPQEGTLSETARQEGEAILKLLGERTAYLAPSAGELETLMPTFFPIRLEFDPEGHIQRILVGDAARAAR